MQALTIRLRCSRGTFGRNRLDEGFLNWSGIVGIWPTSYDIRQGFFMAVVAVRPRHLLGLTHTPLGSLMYRPKETA